MNIFKLKIFCDEQATRHQYMYSPDYSGLKMACYYKYQTETLVTIDFKSANLSIPKRSGKKREALCCLPGFLLGFATEKLVNSGLFHKHCDIIFMNVKAFMHLAFVSIIDKSHKLICWFNQPTGIPYEVLFCIRSTFPLIRFKH